MTVQRRNEKIWLNTAIFACPVGDDCSRAGAGAGCLFLMPPKKTKSTSTGKGKKRRRNSSSSPTFFSSDERDGSCTGNNNNAVPFDRLPEEVRNRIYAEDLRDSIARDRQRLAEVARQDAQFHSDREQRGRVERAFQIAERERREKQADADFCCTGASRAARTAAVAAKVEDVAAKASEKALRKQQLLTKAAKRRDSVMEAWIWKQGADQEIWKEARASLLADTAGSSAKGIAARLAEAEDARQVCVMAAVNVVFTSCGSS